MRVQNWLSRKRIGLLRYILCYAQSDNVDDIQHMQRQKMILSFSEQFLDSHSMDNLISMSLRSWLLILGSLF